VSIVIAFLRAASLVQYHNSNIEVVSHTLKLPSETELNLFTNVPCHIDTQFIALVDAWFHIATE